LQNKHLARHDSQNPSRIREVGLVLQAIISSLNLNKNDCVYVGDSLFKDVAMAHDASVTDVWAKYGQAHYRPEYDLLREVTHWSDEDVEREKKITERNVSAAYVLEDSFSELLALFQFGDTHVS
jgi:FMN phosphatase YigB (HAD superfamily)